MGEITVCRGVVEDNVGEMADAPNEDNLTLAQLFGEAEKPPDGEVTAQPKKKKHKH